MSTARHCRRSLSLCLLASLCGLPLWLAAQEAPIETQTVQLGEWYTVTHPERFVVGTVARIKVAYRGIDKETRLHCDFHYTTSDGSPGGFMANDWRTNGNRSEVEPPDYRAERRRVDLTLRSSVVVWQASAQPLRRHATERRPC